MAPVRVLLVRLGRGVLVNLAFDDDGGVDDVDDADDKSRENH